jgi:hypothetical protein
LIKRNEAQSNTNRGSALTAGKGKEKEPQVNKGQQDSGKTGGATSKDWKCKTHKTDKHEWANCSENPKSKNYKGQKKIKDGDKNKEAGKQAGANVATLKLDNLPAYLPVQLDQIGALQHAVPL